jgi:tetratricopeptide (TPR) repeat protein
MLGVPGDKQPASLDAKAALWRQQLADRRVLLVVDNACNEAQVRPLLPGSPTCAVIVTSRAVLAALDARPWLLNTLDAGEALELLGKLTGNERIAAEPPAAQAVVAACGGLPLALRIAGARLMARPDWQVAQLAKRLTDERRRLAELGLGDLDVRASFQLSHQDLDAKQARLFRLLGVLPGLDFHPWVAAALLNADLQVAEELLDRLVAAQLVEPASDSGRFRLHDLLRLFAREQLDQGPDFEQDAAIGRLLETAIAAVSAAHVALTRRRLRRGQDEGGQVDPRVPLAWLEAERGTLVTLVELATERGLWPAAWNLSELLSKFLSRRGYRADLERVHRWALQAARQAGHREAEARGLSNLGSVLADLGHWEQAVEQHQDALAIWRQTGNRYGQADTLNSLGNVLVIQGQWQQAAEQHKQALTIQQELGDRYGQARSLNGLGNVLVVQGHWQQAADYYQQSLVIKRELGDRPAQALTLSNLGAVFARRHYDKQATDHFQESLTIARELGDRQLQAQTLNSLGNIFHRMHHWQGATDHFRNALTIQQELGDRHGQAQTLTNLGSVLASQDELEQADSHYRNALTIQQELGDRHGQAQALINLGNLLANQNQPEQADSHYRNALTVLRELGDRHGQAQAEYNLGLTLAKRGLADQSTEHWRTALVIFEQLNAPEAEQVRAALQEPDRQRPRQRPPRQRNS